MRKFYSNPKGFKHDGKSGADFERGGGTAKKESEVTNLVKESSNTYLQSTHQLFCEVMKARVFGGCCHKLEDEEIKMETD
jgi:hypothetical protein